MHDIALLKLGEPIAFSGKLYLKAFKALSVILWNIFLESIQAISLHNVHSHQDLSGFSAIASGFGYVDNSNNIYNLPRQTGIFT